MGSELRRMAFTIVGTLAGLGIAVAAGAQGLKAMIGALVGGGIGRLVDHFRAGGTK